MSEDHLNANKKRPLRQSLISECCLLEDKHTETSYNNSTKISCCQQVCSQMKS